ncbi:MAG: hypothetical protein JJU02_07815 [Cryomorphaceae bacterium]|nr:hypothetical protein [Cryomorphaceae bacterium]
MKKSILFLLIPITMTFCSKDDDDNGNGNGNCETENLTYVDDIKPIVDANCAISGCHNSSTYGDFRQYENIRDVALSGVMETRITMPESNAQSMPPTGKLDNCTIDKLIAWANDGAPESKD